MSRIGKKPIIIPKGVQVKSEKGTLTVSGAMGELSMLLNPAISVNIAEEEIHFQRRSDAKTDRSLHGTMRALAQNMVTGVTDGYRKKLELTGVGYRAELRGQRLHLAVGYSHAIVFVPPPTIKLEVPAPNSIIISGIDKQLVGEVAAKIRSFRKPEPYKGKGIRYENERIKRKAGKTAGKAKK